MRCADCCSAELTERRVRTAQGYRRIRCRACGRGFNVRSSGVLNRAQYSSDVIALAKERPGQIAYGSSGVGSAAHLAMEDLMLRTGARMVHSPYRGTQPALQDLLAGRIGAMFDVFPGFAPHLAAGSIRGLGVASAERQGFAPDVPTLIEGGLPDFVASTWCLMLAPANTPPAIVRRISDAAAALLREPATGPRLEALGLAPVGSTPEEATAFLREEIDRWGRVIRAADVRVD